MGNIKLIDPNEEIARYLGFGEGDGRGVSAITPPEDLVTYVNLEVYMPGRSSIVDETAREQQGRYDIGFVVPKETPEENEGQLGTSWTDIGGLEGFINGTRDKRGSFKETFGIQDISIKLNSSFEPQVNITFVDIRGASLMESGNRSPYSVFFHMPYPLFTLTVKGFYGKGITYKLHLIKFNSRFDSDTGNFIINCDFIGFTFTFLADIPAIYADVGPSLIGWYGKEVDGNGDYIYDFGRDGGSNSGDMTKPWPEGGMTLGLYIKKIATMAASIENYEDSETSKNLHLLRDAVRRLETISPSWDEIEKNIFCPPSSTCFYEFEPGVIIVKELIDNVYVNKTNVGSNMVIDNVGGKANVKTNSNQWYSELCGEMEKFRLGVESINKVIDETTSRQLLGNLPTTGIKTYLTLTDVDNVRNEEGDDVREVCGVGIVNVTEFFKVLSKQIKKGKEKIGELEEQVDKDENKIKLTTLEMKPTLNNVFKLLCNGVTAFQKTISEVAELADNQHNKDGNIRSMLDNSSDIKNLENTESKLYSFPLYYETMVEKGDTIERVTKKFPGYLNDSGEYSVDKFISPLKWPEITLTEEVIRILIDNTRKLEQSFDESDTEFTIGYLPAIVEETPVTVLSPYEKLTNVSDDIIPLLYLRSILRLSKNNNIPVTDYTKLGLEKGNSLVGVSSVKVNSGFKNNGGLRVTGKELINVLKFLGKTEAQSMIVGLLDSGGVRLEEVYDKLRNSGNGSVSEGVSANTKGKKALKDLGFFLSEFSTNGDKVNVFSGAEDITKSDANHLYEYSLPNISENLSTNIYNATCDGGSCFGFSIEDVSFFETVSSEVSSDIVLSSDTVFNDFYTKTFIHDDTKNTGQYTKSGKSKVGKYGTLDYDHEQWLGWDFFSYYSAWQAKKEMGGDDPTFFDFTGEHMISPDQFSPNTITYSAPWIYGVNTGNADRKTFLLEDILFIKNDHENTLDVYNAVNSSQSGNDRVKSSNIALAYLYINNVGKYSSSKDGDTDFSKNYNITGLFNQVSGYSTLPLYVVLQIGSWLYRYGEELDIIQWPNHFTDSGVKKENQYTFKKPKKFQRPQPKADLLMNAYFNIQTRNSGKKGPNGLENFLGVTGPSEFNNKLHFLGGQDVDWERVNMVNNNSNPISTCECYGYEELGDELLSLPKHIKEQFINKFIGWALGEGDDHPNFPEIKGLMKETTKVELDFNPDVNAYGERVGTCYDNSIGSLSLCSGCGDSGYLQPGLNNPQSETWVGFCDRQKVSPNDVDIYGNGTKGICANDGSGVYYDFNNGISTSTVEANQNKGSWNSGYNTHGSYNTSTFAMRENNRGQDILDRRYIRNLFNSNQPDWFNYGTPTLPLLFNGFVNMDRVDIPSGNGSEYSEGYLVNSSFSKWVDIREQYSKSCDGDSTFQKTAYFGMAGIANLYYFIRKASHTNNIIYFPMGSPTIIGTNRSITTAYDIPDGEVAPPSPEIQIENGGPWYNNDSYNSFPDVGNEVYKNIHYRNPVKSDKLTSLSDLLKNDELGYSDYLNDSSTPFFELSNSSFGRGNRTKPTFYIPKEQYSVNYRNNETKTTNELHKVINQFMSRRVVIRNTSWRSWMGIGSSSGTTFESIYFNDSDMNIYFDSFMTELNEHINGGDKIDKIKKSNRDSDILNDNDIKLDTYLTLKNIHDKWLTGSATQGIRKNRLGMGLEYGDVKSSLFNQFSFVDRAYNDIGEKLIDPSSLLNLKENPKISLYSLMYDLIADNQFEFFPLPTSIDVSGDEYRHNFVPHLTVDSSSIDSQPHFYVMYMGGFSDSLDMENDGNYEFANDGFDVWGDCVDCPSDFEKGGGEPVKAFAVNFGVDNQNFFKSIALDQAEFQETQESLVIIDALAQEEGSAKDPMLKGQNLMNVYQKRSYSCTVEAFGMMSILPLQYFQLNHVPMFHGVYIIVNVEHKITQGDIATSFKGTRISRSTLPYVSKFITNTNPKTTVTTITKRVNVSSKSCDLIRRLNKQLYERLKTDPARYNGDKPKIFTKDVNGVKVDYKATEPRHQLPVDGNGLEYCESTDAETFVSEMMKRLIDNGFNTSKAKIIACGFAGNVNHESSFGITRIGDNGAAIGLIQWNTSRYDSMVNKFPDRWYTMDGQMDNLMLEIIGGSESNNFNAIKMAQNVKDCCLITLNLFIRSGAVGQAKNRYKAAKKIYDDSTSTQQQKVDAEKVMGENSYTISGSNIVRPGLPPGHSSASGRLDASQTIFDDYK